MTDKNLWYKAYDIVSAMDTSKLKEIDYDEMSKGGKGITEITRGECMGVEYRILFYEAGHPCAYIKIPDEAFELKDVLKTKGYDEIAGQTCHGGLTFGKCISGENMRGFSDGCWIGWDYGHWGDYLKYLESVSNYEELRKWKTEDILVEVVEQILSFKEHGYL